MHSTDLLAVIVLAPLAGALVLGVFGKRLGDRMAALTGCFTVGVSAVLSFYVFFGVLLAQPADTRVFHQYLFTWINVGSFRADAAFLLDPLSGVYILFITFVGFWIHVFSIGYMRGEPGYSRFFCYTNLFMFAMLTLVLADNFLLMFVGWEGVGLCSYLLIGFYFLRGYANEAAKKAFVVNRIGDFGFALGVMLLFWKAGTIFYFNDPKTGVHGAFNWAMTFANDPLSLKAIFAGGITTIAVLMFIGATGKSAQIPLFVWLPDAMAGPTPVSALIHAATMVTAGVYMVSRASAIYVHAPAAMLIIAVVGAATAFFAATVGIAQWDIKKVLAYSTISQLGYMFLACGVGAFSAGVFHVVTHAFFKALLFLCSGSVIVALHHEQDMRRMGGLRKYLPVTFWTMACGWLAISGVPLLSGFFSKDAILGGAFRTTMFSTVSLPIPEILWAVGLVTALITALYMTRLMVLTFWGDERFRGSAHGADHGGDSHGTNPALSDSGHAHTPKESPLSMVLPLVVLAAGALLAGYLNAPKAWLGEKYGEAFSRFLEPSLAAEGSRISVDHFLPGAPAELATGHGNELALMAISSLVAILGILIAWTWFKRTPLWSPPRILEQKYKVDEVYDAAVVQPVKSLSTRVLWRIIDVEIVDGTVNGAGRFTAWIGAQLRYLQSGFARVYVAMVVLGALALIGYFVAR
ncbi:MAG TPA: NADH-quinone oxidoreductase subunit L [Blastocatellia bacterium]|nr:NADH-quinone oxidoreductase subunit L [Blastocatellia bacterium]